MYARIALPIPGKCVFDYLIPHGLQTRLQEGMRVRVPFGRRIATGFCVGFSKSTDVPLSKMREINALLDPEPVVNGDMLSFARWWSGYYFCSLGEALATTVPLDIGSNAKFRHETMIELSTSQTLEQIESLEKKSPAQSRILRFLVECGEPISRQDMRKKLRISTSSVTALQRKGLIRLFDREKDIDPFLALSCSGQGNIPNLTPDQKRVLTEIIAAVDESEFRPFLLFGITGSGKTEIYIRAILHCIARKQQAIVLVPEIALTPQTVMRFKRRFSDVAVLHSELTPVQRAHQWTKIYRGEVPVVIGARSALFAPVRDLGLIVVDEEHEPSFKQQNTPRYHARDLAVKRAQLWKAVVILGSATPSVESYYNAKAGKYNLQRLPNRINASLPKFKVVDMREECRMQKKFVYLSRMLIREIRSCLAAKQQVILFLNRRGFATNILCPLCGYHAKCEHCDIGLTYHKKNERAMCHYCGYDTAPPSKCPVCGLEGVRMLGAGTQRIEKILQKFFPDARMTRMDSDSMTSRRRYEEVFLSFSRGEVDILLGTQMVAKGLDFPRVTLVGVISADVGLQLPDLRAAERTFQLMVQVGGRAGRGENPGQVILQTFNPEHYAITLACTQNYEKFAEKELALRKELCYPPAGKLLRIILQGKDEQKIIDQAELLASVLEKEASGQTVFLGPAPAPIAKVNDRYRWHIIVKSPDRKAILRCASSMQPFLSNSGPLKVQLDRDPISML